MKITLCGSIAFYKEMEEVKGQLEAQGHEVKLPPTHVKNEAGELIPVAEYYASRKAASVDDKWIWDRKEESMRNHFDKVVWADAVLVLNYEKNNISNYIGPNTLMEMGLAFHLKKVIYLLNPMPEMMYTEEIIGLRPIILAGDLSLIVS